MSRLPETQESDLHQSQQRRGTESILTMPETMSVERRNILKAYGAEIVLTEGTKGNERSNCKSRRACKRDPEQLYPGTVRKSGEPGSTQSRQQARRSGTIQMEM